MPESTVYNPRTHLLAAARSYAAASMSCPAAAAARYDLSLAQPEKRLTAAAPDLLAALKALCSMSLMPIHKDEQARFDRAAVLASLAIARAEGYAS